MAVAAELCEQMAAVADRVRLEACLLLVRQHPVTGVWHGHFVATVARVSAMAEGAELGLLRGFRRMPFAPGLPIVRPRRDAVVAEAAVVRGVALRAQRGGRSRLASMLLPPALVVRHRGAVAGLAEGVRVAGGASTPPLPSRLLVSLTGPALRVWHGFVAAGAEVSFVAGRALLAPLARGLSVSFQPP